MTASTPLPFCDLRDLIGRVFLSIDQKICPELSRQIQGLFLPFRNQDLRSAQSRNLHAVDPETPCPDNQDFLPQFDVCKRRDRTIGGGYGIREDRHLIEGKLPVKGAEGIGGDPDILRISTREFKPDSLEEWAEILMPGQSPF